MKIIHIPAIVGGHSHETFVPEEDLKTTVWRYMCVASLFSILQNRALWFTRLTELRLRDKYEGAVPDRDREYSDEILNKYAEFCKDDANKTSVRFFSYIENDCRIKCVNCWHANDGESAAMWKLYSSESGVAIRSSVGRLILGLRGAIGLDMASVQYLNFDSKDSQGTPCPIYFRKRECFSYENEFRVVIEESDAATHAKGILIETDLSQLIERIYVSPVAPPWTAEVVRREVEKYGLKAEIIHSSLYS
jgi:hypothetical protein